MSEALKTFYPANSPDITSVIFLPASVSGVLHSDRPDGLTVAPYGLAHALANLSARQAKALGLTMSGTYGPRSSISFNTESDLMYLSMVSRLQALTRSLGSTLYALTWKQRVTPSGRSIYALRASVRRSSGKDCSGWPAPTVSMTTGAGSQGRDGGLQVQTAVLLAGWTNPLASEGRQGYQDRSRGKKGSQESLTTQVINMVGWASPAARDGRSASGSEEFLAKRLEQTRGKPLSEEAFALAGWPSPTARDHFPAHTPEYIAAKRAQGHGMQNLNDSVMLAQDCPARLTASGELLTGSDAGMTSGGQLNPEHSLWLMGIPKEWASCAARAMQSLPKLRKRSSK